MRLKLSVLILFATHNILLNGQSTENLQGTVTLVTSQSVYVRFRSTGGISSGDTLYIIKGGKLVPALRVKNLSSVSCLCVPLTSYLPPVKQTIVAKKKPAGLNQAAKPVNDTIKSVAVPKLPADTMAMRKEAQTGFRQRISGSISAYSYTTFSNTAANSTQFRYTLSLGAKHIGDSRFSVNSYISFRHDPEKWAEVKHDLFSALKVYSLSLGYDPSLTTHISLGRTMNYRLSSIGAMDGLQIEQSAGNFSFGVVAGFRPDFENLGFNSDLFQYGGYIAHSSVKSGRYAETSMAFMQQTNNSKTDRRFLYFQHSNSLIKNIYFLSTFEVDLYKLKNEVPANVFDPTGLYVYLRIKMTKKISLAGSYDARKNIVYYETYKSFADRILETEMRQSYRLQADYRITGKISIGVQSGYRFLKSDPLPSRNIYGYFSYYQIPGIRIALRLSGTYLESSYLKSKIFGINLSRDLLNGKLSTSTGYHFMENKYPENTERNVQNIFEVNVNWFVLKKTSMSVNYEGTFGKNTDYTRLFLQIRKRF